jgi:hypothetical protein
MGNDDPRISGMARANFLRAQLDLAGWAHDINKLYCLSKSRRLQLLFKICPLYAKYDNGTQSAILVHERQSSLVRAQVIYTHRSIQIKMAPHALTPTAEREELFDGSHLVPQHDDFLSNSTSSFPARNTNIAHDQTASSQNAVHNGHMGSTSNGSLAANGSSMNNACGNPPTKSYEDAYTHGYTDGYTSGYKTSTIELKHQPIAIIGMSCRLPGSVSTPDEFWELLARSRTGFSPIPASRFSADRFFHPNPGKSGTTNARGGNFLTQDLTAFDAPFFGFTQQEAISLDPQQRLLLECTFEALETAGIPKQDIVGKDVGVFIGGTFSEYETDLFRDPETMPMHQATGM